MRTAFLLSMLVASGSIFATMPNEPTLAQKAAKSVAVLPGATGKEPINIDAGKLEYFDKEQKAVYTGAVVAVQGESRLKTEVLTIFLDRSGGATGEVATPGTASQVRRMEASGGVTIIQKDQVGTGDRGAYDKVENKVYLFGNVTLSQGPNVTKGEKLTYDLTSGQAVIEGGRVKSMFIPGSQPEGTHPTRKTKTSPARRRRKTSTSDKLTPARGRQSSAPSLRLSGRLAARRAVCLRSSKRLGEGN